MIINDKCVLLYKSIIFDIAGAPTQVHHLTTISGDIIYTVMLPVRLNQPTKLNITYVNDQNEVLLPKIQPPQMEYSDADSIFYHENRDVLPTAKYRVQAALYIDMGSQRVQGEPFTSQQTISKLIQ